LLNPEDGVVNTDGSFSFIHPKNLNVKIVYDGSKKMVTVNYDDVERIKADLNRN